MINYELDGNLAVEFVVDHFRSLSFRVVRSSMCVSPV
jgi:hypothetical protein